MGRVQFRISVFGFEIQDSSNFKIASRTIRSVMYVDTLGEEGKIAPSALGQHALKPAMEFNM